MYFYKEVRKREVALTSQLAKWCMDDYNCFIQKYLLGDDYFDCLIYRSQIYIDDNKRPCLENRAVINTENLIEKRLFIFVKTEGSFYAKPFVQTLFSKNNELSSHRFCLQSICYQTCFVNFIRSFVVQPLMNPFTIEELYKFPETFSQFLCT